MIITHYPLFSAILLLIVGGGMLSLGFRFFSCDVQTAKRDFTDMFFLAFGFLIWSVGLNVLDGQMLAVHSPHSIELFLSVILFFTGAPLLFHMKFDPLFYQRASSPYHVWEAFHPTAWSAVGLALVIISALIISP